MRRRDSTAQQYSNDFPEKLLPGLNCVRLIERAPQMHFIRRFIERDDFCRERLVQVVLLDGLCRLVGIRLDL